MNTDEWSRKLEEIPLIDLPPAGPGPFAEQCGTRPRGRPGAISGSRVFLGQHIHEAASEGSWMQTSSFPTIAIRSQPSRSCRFANSVPDLAPCSGHRKSCADANAGLTGVNACFPHT